MHVRKNLEENFIGSLEQMQEADAEQELTPVDELLPAAELEQSEVSAELRGKFESALAAERWFTAPQTRN